MKRLKLPVIDNIPEHDKWLSMDEYIKFLNFTAKYFRRKGSKKIEAGMLVNVPFSIKG